MILRHAGTLSPYATNSSSLLNLRSGVGGRVAADSIVERIRATGGCEDRSIRWDIREHAGPAARRVLVEDRPCRRLDQIHKRPPVAQAPRARLDVLENRSPFLASAGRHPPYALDQPTRDRR